MKGLMIIIVLAALAYGGKWLYDNQYFSSFNSAFDNTMQRTSDYVTDKAVKEANF